jgi:putative transposase
VVEGAAYYHCMSRVVGGERMLGEREREVLRRMLWQVAEFCGVRVVTYALMSNHFHILVEVPEGLEPVGDEELGRRYAVLYGRSRSPWQPKPEVMVELLRVNGREGQRWRALLRARMGDLSAFMKTLKQRFSVWYNQTHNRYGTFWADRFRSVLVEGSPQALLTVAAYIDLNPVRAGLVEDPADYRWCGYAEAMGGKAAARDGLSRAFGSREAPQEWSETAARYRRFLFGKGSGGALEKAKVPRERVVEVLREGGTVPRAEALRCRLRYFTDGAVLGSAAFVRAWREAQGRRGARARPSPPQPLKGADWEGLTVARSLRSRVFG